MIDQGIGISGTSTQQAETGHNNHKKVLRMVKNSRTAGSIPVWEKVSTPRQEIEQDLSQAQNGKPQDSFENTLAYHADSTDVKTPEEFGFSDLIDMVNPLQHIPVVSHIYRSLTGDDIKPIGKIIGGAVYGGPAGVASGLANVIVEQETGHDLAENATAFMTRGTPPKFEKPSGHPETILTAATKDAHGTNLPDLPASLLAFTDTGRKTDVIIEKTKSFGDRTAGTIFKRSYPEIDNNALPPREPITQLTMSTFPRTRTYNN